MNSMEEQYGYDSDFVDEVAESLQCVVCHLVMRQPVQIMTCGHRLCKACYERIQVYSKHLSTPLLCPIDRDPIDVTKVFNDTAISRDIKNLQVRCRNAKQLCPWRGELQNLQAHEQSCEYKVLCNQSATHEQNHDSLKMIEKRLIKFEDLIAEKEKDIDMLRKENGEMKKENADAKVRMDILNESNMELRKLIENNSALIKNPPPEFFEEVLNPVVENLCTKEIDLLKKENIEMKKDNADIKFEVDILKKSNEELKKMIENNLALIIKNPPTEIVRNNEHSLLENTNRIKNLSNDFDVLREQVEKITKSNNDPKVEQKDVVDIKNKNNHDNKTAASKNDLKDLEDHVRNLENLSFCNASQEVLIQWKLDNFQHHVDADVKVWSPIFLTEIDGFSFQLLITWKRKDNKKYMSVFMYLQRGKNFIGDLKPFNIPYSLEMVANNGKVLSRKITQVLIDNNRHYFEIQPGKNSTLCFGIPTFLNMDFLKDYVINDMVTINCRLNP